MTYDQVLLRAQNFGSGKFSSYLCNKATLQKAGFNVSFLFLLAVEL